MKVAMHHTMKTAKIKSGSIAYRRNNAVTLPNG